MASTIDYTGTSVDQLSQHQHQDNSPPQNSLQSQLLNTYLYPHSQSESDHWSSRSLSYEYGSQGTFTQRISPTSDVIGEMATTMNEVHQVPSSTKELEPSQSYGYNLNGQGHGHDHSQPSNSFASTSSSFQTDFGCNGNVDSIYPINNDFTSPLSSLNGNLYPIPDLNFQNLSGFGYRNNDNNTTIWQATQSNHGTYDFINANNNAVIDGEEKLNDKMNTDQALPVSASTQALFQSIQTDSKLQNIPKDQTHAPSNDRPSRFPIPLLEVAEAEGEVDKRYSPEMTGIKPGRRASEGTPFTSRQPIASKRRSRSLSINVGASASASGKRLYTAHLDPEAKATRAAATEGLVKGDKRRMQNRLAQRAFRARSKIVKKNAAGRLEHLEESTEQQAGRIATLTDLVGRLQKENYALKLAKFQETSMKGGLT